MKQQDSSSHRNDFVIGQVVYILSNKNQSIIPAMIVEESIVKTLESQTVSWKLAIGSKKNPEKPQRVIDSTKIDGEIYSKLAMVHSVLQTRLTSFLNNTITDVQKREKAWYGTVSKLAPDPVALGVATGSSNTMKPEIQASAVMESAKVVPQATKSPAVKSAPPVVVVAPDAKIDPESFLSEDDIIVDEVEPVALHSINQQQQDSSAIPRTEAEIKEQLKRMTLADDDLDPDSPIPGEGERIQIVDTVVGPNGMEIPVNFKL